MPAPTAERGAEVLVITRAGALRVGKVVMRLATWALLRLVAAMDLVVVVKGVVPRKLGVLDLVPAVAVRMPLRLAGRT